MPKFDWIRKVMVLGSGAIKIGEAAEFDYSGSQCLKALREEGIETVLINPNIATIQTDPRLSGKVYLLPVTPEYVEKVIEKERPDGILLGFGGQTALNCGIELFQKGVYEKYGVKVLGTPVEAIETTGNRELFKQAMVKADAYPLKSKSATTVRDALEAANEIGYPVIVRVAYTLGGKGSGVAHNAWELGAIVTRALAQSRITQVLVEEYVGHWKEIEYEVVRDYAGNCLIVCNMENLDPMGIHTGDSIVVAPSQTLSDKEYQMLRSASLRIIRALGIEGGCNIQFALAPRREIAEWAVPPGEGDPPYFVIEVNPRVSRSSALASKATGYPIARVASKIAVGKRLDEIPNAVTQRTTAAFEPALDYVVVKIPRWPFDKFAFGDRHLGTQMKATGEVMAIDRSFEAAIQKAVRSLEQGGRSLAWEDPAWREDDPCPGPRPPTDDRLWRLMAALRRAANPMELAKKTGVDPWFLDKLGN